MDNVRLGLDREASATWAEAVLHFSRSRRDERVMYERAEEALELAGIAQFAGQTVAAVPYGVQRRFELARALVGRPTIVLLDEPGAGLNDDERVRLVEVVQAVSSDGGPGVVLVDHNMELIRQACTTAVVMTFGSVLTKGPVGDVLSDERVVAAYLGTGEETVSVPTSYDQAVDNGD